MQQPWVRELPTEKQAIHYPDFSSFLNLTRQLSLDTSWFEHDVSQEEWRGLELQQKRTNLMQDLSKQLLSNPSSVRKELDAIYDYLSEADTDTDGEVIFAFATNSLSNLDKALELYRAFLPRDLVFSGRGDDANRNAAQTYRDLAIEAGVPREFIVRELTSSTLLESVCESLSLFEEFQWSLKRIILVNSPHLQRRGWCLFKKHLPEVVGLQRQNSKAETGYGREDWFTHQKGIDAIFYEFFAMKEAAVMNVA